MTKRRNNLNQSFRRGMVALALTSTVLPGCKKEEPPPPPAQVQPLPKKAVQGGTTSAKSAQAAPAGKPVPGPAAPPVQAKPAASPAVPPPSPGATATAVQASGSAGVQKQLSSARVQGATAVNLDFTKRRDPFRPYVQAPAAPPPTAGKAVRPVKDLLPIQSFETESFKVTGIIAGINNNSALVIDPKGKGYVVREGMLLGSNNGRIKKITTSAVEVEENFRDDSGKVRKRVVKLALTRKK